MASSARRRSGGGWSRGPVVVGIGASAGGLEALQAMLGPVRRGCRLSFVVVQHQESSRHGLLVELLGRSTRLPVSEIQDGSRVQAGHVHVMPSDRDVILEGGVFRCEAPFKTGGVRLSVDRFLRSLADEAGLRSIGVILSGMGSDGVLGLRAIKAVAGLCFVQEPSTAKCEGMPRAAMEAGLADRVVVPGQLVKEIEASLESRGMSMAECAVGEGADGVQLAKVFSLLRARTGQDFSRYKKSTLCRRIERRMALHHLGTLSEYVHFLGMNPVELDLLSKELLIGVTGFFRDPALWKRLAGRVLPALIESRPRGAVLRGWSAGCSTGEEAYSLAMVFRELMEGRRGLAGRTVQLFATDIDRDAIDKARAGVYPANILTDIGESRLGRFFISEGSGFRVEKGIRSMVVFAQQNLILDPPFTKLDIIVCRNLLIYLEPELQQMVLGLFHFALRPGGILVLGSAETVGPATGLFSALPGDQRIYRRLETGSHPGVLGLPTVQAMVRPAPGVTDASAGRATAPGGGFQTEVEHLLIHRLAPPAVLTNAKGDILYVGGRTGRYLEPAGGKASLNLFAMAREGLGTALTTAFARAQQTRELVALDGVVFGPESDEGTVDLRVEVLSGPESLKGMVLTVFAEPPGERSAKARGRRMPLKSVGSAAVSRELERCRQELNHLREEMQVSQEELRSTNEELQSTNEELQSANEELTTSKEEMQSMNEELQTVNHELRSRLEELSRSADDMSNLLGSMEIGTLFLDGQLRLRRYTTQTSSPIHIVPGDAGRSISGIVRRLDYPSFATDIREVLQTLVPRERRVRSRDGRWMDVRVTPYRTRDNRIDGVLVTLLDVTVAGRDRELLDRVRRVLNLVPGVEEEGGLAMGQARRSLARIRRLVEQPGMPAGRRP